VFFAASMLLCVRFAELEPTRQCESYSPRVTVSIDSPRNTEVPNFAQRLRAAFRNARDAEIARLLGYRSQSPIAKWFEGTYPNTEVLLKIAQITKVNLHWLLTGEGTTLADKFDFLGEALAPVREIAELHEQEIEELVRFLVREALLVRCSQLMQRFDDLPPDEFREFRVLLRLFSELSVAEIGNGNNGEIRRA